MKMNSGMAMRMKFCMTPKELDEICISPWGPQSR